VDEFFPSLLELVRCKIDIPSVPNRTSDTTPHSDDVQTVCATLCADCKSSSPDIQADGVIANLQKSQSAPKWYYFSSGFCSEYVKSPTSRNQLEQRSHPDGQGTMEHVVTVNGFAEH